MHSASTVESATEYVIGELERTGSAERRDFDVPALVKNLYSLIDGWDFHSLDRTVFWSVAACHLRL